MDLRWYNYDNVNLQGLVTMNAHHWSGRDPYIPPPPPPTLPGGHVFSHGIQHHENKITLIQT